MSRQGRSDKESRSSFRPNLNGLQAFAGLLVSLVNQLRCLDGYGNRILNAQLNQAKPLGIKLPQGFQ